jgi:hypothetical protein
MVFVVGEGGGFAGGADGDDAVGSVFGLEFDLLFEGGAVKLAIFEGGDESGKGTTEHGKLQKSEVSYCKRAQAGTKGFWALFFGGDQEAKHMMDIGDCCIFRPSERVQKVAKSRKKSAQKHHKLQ